MTTQSDGEVGGIDNESEFSIGEYGSSVYGGRPNFALARRSDSDGTTLTLYELLPEAQVEARRERLKTSSSSHRKMVSEEFTTIFGDSAGIEAKHWSWKDWQAMKIARLSGTRLRSVLPLVKETLSDAGHGDKFTVGSGHTDIFLPESAGVRFALLFLGTKPIQRVDRMRAFCRGIARMSEEECYYWYAKCRSPSSPNGEKALRTLLTEHI